VRRLILTTIPAARDGAANEFAALVNELLDAHADTARLAVASAHTDDVCGRAHLDYRRALQQRLVRETHAWASRCARPPATYSPPGTPSQ
jgi:hypothetical protein